MGYQIYSIKKDDGGERFAGYGVPAICEYPDCDKEIDRGISFACGGKPFSEHGCDRYFCSKHLDYKNWDESEGDWCAHEEDCDCDLVELCERCIQNKDPFPYKPEHKDWMKHVLKHSSWKTWRKNNPDTVAEFKKALNIK